MKQPQFKRISLATPTLSNGPLESLPLGVSLSQLGTLISYDATATRTSHKKVNLSSFSLYRDYSYPRPLSNVGESSRSRIPMYHIQVSYREIKFRRCLFTSSTKSAKLLFCLLNLFFLFVCLFFVCLLFLTFSCCGHVSWILKSLS